MNPESLFSSTALPHERTKFLPLSDFSLPIGPFPLALDYFGDGSMYVIDAPGLSCGTFGTYDLTS
jgi:hypothetical protein